MKQLLLIVLSLSYAYISAQDASISGQLQEPNSTPALFANVALYNSLDSSLVKVETTDENGAFKIANLAKGIYFLEATYVGFAPLIKTAIEVKEAEAVALGKLTFEATAVALEEVSITASRTMVEIKPDRTVFNVEGTINSTGSDAITLLRKAPGVTVDNNDNINILGRSGVLLYVDGKRLPLTGEDLTNYLQNLQADQIDRIEIITNPGARYEAEGNAGIIDIRLKKDKNLGMNGTTNFTFSQGRYPRGNVGASGNYRNKQMNVFGNLGWSGGRNFSDIDFQSVQNGVFLVEKNRFKREFGGINYRLGADFFVRKNHTIGFLYSGGSFEGNARNNSSIRLSSKDDRTTVDSILIANDRSEDSRINNTYNLNYRFDNGKGRTVNVDLDYGDYNNDRERFQPNQYFDASGENLLTEIVNSFDTPTDIDIYTFKVDFEEKLFGGKLGIGTKFSRVVSDNSFLFYDVIDEEDILNDRQSNTFEYTEDVYAGYLNFARSINEKLNFTAGVRAEQTDATGDLRAFLPELQEPPVDLNYLNWFPSAGLTWQVARQHSLALNYGRRINRPDYNVLNPFNNQLNQLSFESGNPFLRPEIVNNLELGYTYGYRYNFKIAYSRTEDQITRLIQPNDSDPRANEITWDNLAEQTIISFNVSAPIEVTKKWNAYINFSASHLDNQADYGNGAVIDLQAFTYNIYQQSTFDLPKGIKGEISGYFSGPGVWGGVFEYESNWSLNLGLQKRFLNEQLNIRLSANDLFYQAGWDGFSEFNGLFSEGSGRWDSRRVSMSVSYNFGNQNVKSRKRKTGLEDEAGRVEG